MDNEILQMANRRLDDECRKLSVKLSAEARAREAAERELHVAWRKLDEQAERIKSLERELDGFHEAMAEQSP